MFIQVVSNEVLVVVSTHRHTNIAQVIGVLTDDIEHHSRHHIIASSNVSNSDTIIRQMKRSSCSIASSIICQSGLAELSPEGFDLGEVAASYTTLQARIPL
jgi:hypothetical protein